MEFKNLAEKRYSVRGYQNKEVEEDKINHILECSRLAPSAANRQPWKIYIVKDKTVKDKLVESYSREWLAEAPLIAAFVGQRDENWRRRDGEDYLLCDVTILADYFTLAAADIGLGTCYIAAFDEQKASEALSLAESERVMLLTPLGYAKEGATRKRDRKQLRDIIIYK